MYRLACEEPFAPLKTGIYLALSLKRRQGDLDILDCERVRVTRSAPHIPASMNERYSPDLSSEEELW